MWGRLNDCEGCSDLTKRVAKGIEGCFGRDTKYETVLNTNTENHNVKYCKRYFELRTPIVYSGIANGFLSKRIVVTDFIFDRFGEIRFDGADAYRDMKKLYVEQRLVN